MKRKNIKILIVEDEIIASQYLNDILTSLNYKNIYEATTITEALNIIRKTQIDLIFMDINIEGNMDGIHGAHILNMEYPLPIIFTTAYKDSATIQDANETNIFGYLIKPFEESDVEATLSIALKQIEKTKKNHPSSEENTVYLGIGQKFNFSQNTFFIDNKPIHLTKNELKLMNLFCKNINNNISYDVLREYIWDNKNITDSNIRDTISRLKKKAPNLIIKNVAGFGYILNLNNN